MPKSYGNWHTIYVRMNRWSKSGVLQRIFQAPQEENIICIKVEAVCLDSTSVKVHPNGTEALKKAENRLLDDQEAVLQRRFIWLRQLNRSAVCFSLSAGQAHDAPEGETLLGKIDRKAEQKYLLMDRAYES